MALWQINDASFLFSQHIASKTRAFCIVAIADCNNDAVNTIIINNLAIAYIRSLIIRISAVVDQYCRRIWESKTLLLL
ncbi:hypothetical protein Lepto7376_1934 [[Leptolyngbya] sp. PCC 7376]|uniref:hypothetical protein n=1 Tax=[Leptolyngbya] sp. PCC 7376 TaxID=111781 RepID=UPI00029F4094|nr:hypothetical protein [[Leptolyngbya] sp. PCC 7376]AFY38248.1 hypothetical protein Lepto7376_1934 [[Leptolyngbya] sp. PCC 7376]